MAVARLWLAQIAGMSGGKSYLSELPLDSHTTDVKCCYLDESSLGPLGSKGLEPRIPAPPSSSGEHIK
jgi:hypothetical protein